MTPPREPWSTSTGHARTGTREWQRTRAWILARDGRICYLCGLPGADTVDHKVPVYRGGSEDDHNLGAVHDDPCHRSKTSREGVEARQPRQRPAERHPGILW